MKLRTLVFLALLLIVLTSALFAFVQPAQGLTFTVTTTADSGAGSLREAITLANGNAGADSISFNIAGCPSGVCTISLLSPLPAITDALTLDGITQTGAACPNTPRIMISAGNASAANSAAFELTDSADNSLIRGFSIIGFNGVNGRGVWFNSADNSRLECSFIGLRTNGVTTAPNTVGVYVSGAAANNVIGTNGDGTNDSTERNLISANTSYGVYLTDAGTTGNRIAGNYIGAKVSANELAGNSYGVYLTNGAAGNYIGSNFNGTADELEGNLIAGNLNDGIALVGAASTGNRISRNRLYTNGGMGIDLNDNGLSTNDLNDPDTGPNNLQNFPLVTTGFEMGQTLIGTLNSLASQNYRIEFYASATCDGTGNGEGQSFMGAVTGATNASGNLSFSVNGLTVPPNQPYVTALAINTSSGDTSEFSPCYHFTPQAYTVINTNDSGAGSLRQAIIDANLQPGKDTISFNIPAGSCPGGVCTITLSSDLPIISAPLILDGTTQGGASCPNTPRVVIQGSNALSYGIQVNNGGSTSLIRGLIVGGFGGTNDTGILLNDADSVKIQCSFVGTDASGTAANANNTGIRLMGGASNVIIGVDGDGINDALERNLIAGNTNVQITFADAASGGNRIAGSYIGTDVTGMANLAGWLSEGVTILSTNNLIGTNSDGISDTLERNIIGSGWFASSGISLQGSFNRVSGNYLWVNAAATASLGGNLFVNGIVISAPDNVVGTNGDSYGDALEGNVIGGITYSGVVLNASNNRVAGNAIGVTPTGIAIANGDGVEITQPSNIIGSNEDGISDTLEGNVIAFHGEDGVFITGAAASRNRIARNRIYNNTGLGIDLGDDGVSANDGGDGDTGPNNLQNFPTLTSAVLGAGSVTVSGTLNASASTSFRIEIYSNTACGGSGNGEGRSYRGFVNVTTNGGGNASFNLNVDFSLDEPYYSALAIRTSGAASGDTSEFSNCVTYVGSTYTVTSTGSGSNAGTLRYAINQANSSSDFSVINFNIPASACTGGVCTIAPIPLPTITAPVWINGTSQSGASCPNTPLIDLNLSGQTMRFTAGANRSIVQGLILRNTASRAIWFDGSSDNVVICTFIGTSADGSAWSAVSEGIYINDGARNRIGTDADGFNDGAEGNLIAGNTAITITGASSTQNRVAGNLINLRLDGTAIIQNSAAINQYGIQLLNGAINNWIGTDGQRAVNLNARNTIAGVNVPAIMINNATQNTIAGNTIGVNTSGTGLLDPARLTSGITIQGGATSNIIGTNGDGQGDAAEGNLIAGNASIFVLITGAGTNTNRVAGNTIGTNAAGTARLGALNSVGVSITTSAANNIIGTNGDGQADVAERNLIAGNPLYDVLISSSSNRVAGNFIGTNAAGTAAIGTSSSANVQLGAGGQPAASNIIGTNGDGVSDALEGNLIGGSTLVGIGINEVGSQNNRIGGNQIGLNLDKSAALVLRYGIAIANGAANNLIGSDNNGTSDSVESNLISGTTEDGIVVTSPSAVGNRFSRNLIYGNTGIGIDLNDDGISLNDAGDGDSGPNGLQNTPVLASLLNGGDSVSGLLNSTANRTFRLEFFASSSCTSAANKAGQSFMGAGTTTTDGSGSAVFTIAGLTPLTGLPAVTATATDTVTGDTSEFSNCVTPGLIIDHTDPSTLFADEGSFVAEGASIGDRFLLRFPTAPTGPVTVTITSSDPSRLRILTSFFPSFNSVGSANYTYNPSDWSIPRAVNLFAPEISSDPVGPERFTVTLTVTATADPVNYPIGLMSQTQVVYVYDPGLSITPTGTPTLNLPTPGSRGSYAVALSAPPGLILYTGGVINKPEVVTVGIGTITGTGSINVGPTSRSFNRANWNQPQTFEVTRTAAGTMTINHLITSDITGVATSRYGGPNPVTVSSAVINTPADVRLTHSASPKNSKLPLGAEIVYSVALHNQGTGDSWDLKLTHRLPQGAAFVSAQSGVGVPCVYDPALNLVKCDYTGRKFGVGQMDTVTIRARVNGAAGLPLIAYASVTGLQADPNPKNNTDIASPVNHVDGPTTDIYSIDPVFGSLLRLTNDPTDDYQPAYSRDGGKIAFVSMRDGNAEIYTMRADGSSLRRLTRHSDPDLFPAWSPDGTRIVFASSRDGGGMRLFVIDADGANLRELGGGAEAQQPTWSPDGSRIAYVAGVGSGSFDLFVMNADGTGVTRLTEGLKVQFPAFSPDGSKIAFTAYRDGNAELYLYQNGAARRLTHNTFRDEDPTWTPDGTRLVMVSDRTGRSGMYLLWLSSGQAVPVRNTGVKDSQPAWGGSRIVFARLR